MKIAFTKAKSALILHSGGQDSTTCLAWALKQYDHVQVISFDYGQKHKAELLRAQSFVKYLGDNGIQVRHQIIDLSTLTPLLNSALVSGGNEVPEGHYENENMKATVVPNRNKIFSSLIQSVALSIANETEQDVKIR